MRIPMPRVETFVCGHCNHKARHTSINHGRLDKPHVKLNGQKTRFQSYDLMRCDECLILTLCIHDNINPGSMMGDPYETKTYYYPATPIRTLPPWFRQLKGNLRKLMPEIYQAVNYGLRSIASTGIRTIIDQVIMDKVGDAGNFEQKLNALLDAGILDLEEVEPINTIINAGSASAHRAFVPTTKTIMHMIDIMESMLEKIYIVPRKKADLIKKADVVKKSTPKRKNIKY